MSPEQHVRIISAYIKSLFNYFLLVWVFSYRGFMHKMDKIHKRSLYLLLENYKDDFQDILRSSGGLSIHQRCINSLLPEVYKYIHGLSPEIMNEVFCSRANTYNTQFNVFETHIPSSDRCKLNSTAYKTHQLWNLLPENLKPYPSLTLFKNEIKFWECFNYPCNSVRVMFQTYVIAFHAISFSLPFFLILDTGLRLVLVIYQLQILCSCMC